MAERSGGLCLEDFHAGQVVQHRLGRTISPTDNAWFTLLTLNSNPIHFDAHYASQSRFGRPLVNSTLTLALVTGISVRDLSENAVANLGWDEVTLPNPVFEGDTLYARSEVLDVRPSRTRDKVGILTVRTIGYNERGDIVISFKRTIMLHRRGHVTEPPVPVLGEDEVVP